MLRVDVDFRERDAELTRELRKHPHLTLHETALSAGDYAIGRHVGIERKSRVDLAQSIVDGRLFRQAGRLARRFERPLVLVEGNGAVNVSPEALLGAEVALSVIFRIPVLHSSGPAESARLLAMAFGQTARSFENGYVRPGYRPRGLRARRLFILQGFPRIGPHRAAALLDRFGTIESIVRADADALCSVRGIGPATARHLVTLVRGVPDG